MRPAFLLALLLALTLGGLLVPDRTLAAPRTVTPGETDTLALAPLLEVLPDPAGTLTLDEVAAERGGNAAFQPATATTSFGLTTGTAWGRVRLDLSKTVPADRWLIAIETLLIGRADLFLIADDGRLLGWEARGLTAGTVPAGTIQHRVDLAPYAGGVLTLYMRAQSRFVLVLTPVLRTELAQMKRETEILGMQAVINGSIASMALLFGAHWLLLGGPLYAYAFGAALGIGITSFFGSGLNRFYGLSWPDNLDWWILEGGSILALHCLPKFLIHYLDLPARGPALHRRLRRCVTAVTALNIALMVFLPHRLLTGLTATFFMVSALALWLILFRSGSGRRERRSLLLALGPFLLFTALHLVAFNRWMPELLPWRGWVPQLFTIGLATLLLGFSLAVADQIRFRLERLVEARTKQLSAANGRTEKALVAEQDARQRLRQFIRMAAHEFKNPLAVIDGAAQVLPLLVGTLTADAQRRLDNIRANVNRLLGLIDACFADDRLEETGLVLKTASIDVAAMIEDVAQQQRLLHARVIQISTHGLPPAIQGDPELLRMVFNALLDNAAKYSPPKVAIEVESACADGRLTVDVLDRGPGLPKGECDRLFTRYFRASNVSAVPGTGLGLYLAKSIVDGHQGRLSFRDRDGGGTVFRVELPAGGAHPLPITGADPMSAEGFLTADAVGIARTP